MSSDVREDLSLVVSFADRIIKQFKSIEPESKSLIIQCPEEIAEFSMLIRPGLLRRHIWSNVKIPTNETVDIEILSPVTFNKQVACVCKSDTDFTIDLSKLDEECMTNNSALVVVKYEIEGGKITKKLVDPHWQADSPGSNGEENYWMTARLKHLPALETIYGNMDLRDIELTVDVGIYEKLRTALPKDFIRRFETLERAIKETDRNKMFLALMEYANQRHSKSSADDYSKIGEFQTLFTSPNFKQYVRIDRPFYYGSAFPEQSQGGLADGFGIPKYMKVTSRTNLTLDRPTAEGYLHYTPEKLIERIEKILKG